MHAELTASENILQAALKAKDEQYVKALRQGVQDLDQLQDTMARSAQRQRLLFEQELLGIEGPLKASAQNSSTDAARYARHAAPAVLVLKYLTLGTKISNLNTQEWDDLFQTS
jgi:hypothetical protein